MKPTNSNLHENNTVKENDTNLLVNFDKRKIVMYQKAQKEKIFVVGDEALRLGMKADYSHLDYLLSIIKFREEGTRLEDLTVLWGHLWEYLGPVLTSYKNISNAFLALEQDQNEVLGEYGENALELKIYKGFLKTRTELARRQFEVYRREVTRQQNERLKKIQEENEEKKRL